MPRRPKKNSDLATWLGTASTPLFVLDPERRIRVFNAGCQSLTGWTAADVVGVVCQYASVADVAGGVALAASLCPPPEVFAGQELATPAQIVLRDGDVAARTIHYFPLLDPQRQLTGVLGLIGEPAPPGATQTISATHRLHAELAALRGALRQRFGQQSLVASSLAMRRVLAQLDLAVRTNTFALLVGEPGTGREHLARVIHFGGAARGQWFIPLDCRRMAADELERVIGRLLEVHRAPATGSATPQPGTLFLSDVDSLPRDLQQRLCAEFLTTGKHRPVSPLRLLASTSKSLGELMAAGDIRPDFAALISPLVIELPPLRDRPEDLPLLSQHFLEELNRQGDRQIAGLDEDVAKLLTEHDWPRNLDELWEVIRDAHAVATGRVIALTDLSARFRSEVAGAMPAPAQVPALNLDAILSEAETRVIRLALDRCRDNRTQAAALLGIHRTRLIRRIEQLGLGKDVVASTADATASDTIVDGEQAGEGDELGEKTERGTS